MRGVNLRAMINSGLEQTIFRSTGNQILEWVNEKSTGLSAEEELRLMAIVMKVQGNKTWYDHTNEGNNFSLYTM